MSSQALVADPSTEAVLQWLALGLTPGLGATRVRRLVEHFGSVSAIFRASLTELEATGMLAVSAQALATGRSLELAQEEKLRITEAGASVLTLDDRPIPRNCAKSTTLPLSFM